MYSAVYTHNTCISVVTQLRTFRYYVRRTLLILVCKLHKKKHGINILLKMF